MDLNLANAISQPAPPAVDFSERFLRFIEAIGVFLLGAVLMNVLYAGSVANAGDEIGVPEYDSYYHVAMAEMLPERGILTKFPWLQYTYFRNHGDDFVSHHFGFHVLLLPFVTVAKWLTGDALPGGRWAMSAVMGANLLLFHLLMRHRRVPLHWLWIVLFLLLPDQFFARHGYVRAIGSSLLFMQLLLLFLFQRRWFWAAITLTAYVHLYLGAVMFGPIIVIAYFFSHLFAPAADRSFPWQMALITAGGWLLGVVTYPYASGMYEFLWLQVFGSGLSPDIPVGREWFPYTDAKFLIEMAAITFNVWVVALLLRFRFGPRLDAAELSLLILQFLFLVLTIRARRFIEYWPPVCLLFSAYIAAPPLRMIIDEVQACFRKDSEAAINAIRWAFAACLLSVASLCIYLLLHRSQLAPLSEWQVWMFVAALLVLPAYIRIWRERAGGFPRMLTIPEHLVVIAGGALIVGVTAAAFLAIGKSIKLHAHLQIPGFAWGALTALYGIVPLLVRRRPKPDWQSAAGGLARSATAFALAFALPALALTAGTPSLISASRQLRRNFDLAEIRKAMAFLKENSNEGDIVFTDDWDIFPALFYHNRKNHYIVGLDPKFTHWRRPDLWDRYVKISRGEVPATIRTASGPKEPKQSVTVTLKDIREQFRARWVIADRDHRKLASVLAEAPGIAECAYPDSDYRKCANADYVIFRIRDAGEAPAEAAEVKPDREGKLSLAALTPLSAVQGFGDLRSDRSVDGNPLRMRGRMFAKGLGTHAPAKLVYDIPPGATHFSAIVGIDDETDANGSAIVSILLDGRSQYESPPLRGDTEPLVVRIPLGGSKQITLSAETTIDGQRFDHVDWAEAVFEFGAPASSQKYD